MADTRFRCPNPDCGALFEAEPGEEGRAVPCPRCGSSAEGEPISEPATESREDASSVPTSLVVGSTFADRYKVLRRLDRGGMGVVYLVDDLRLGYTAALKIPLTAWRDDEEFLRRFVREARAMARLRHPNICRVQDVARHDGLPYFTMDFIEGNSLKEYLDRRNTSTDPIKAARLIRELAKTLQYAHDKGVIHRDLKPSNIMMSEGRPIVLDFGLARLEDPIDSLRTRTGATMGTPAYLPLEQLRGENEEIGPRSDVYSLGVIFFQLLTGRLPYEGPTWSILEQILISPQPPSPMALRPDLDPSLDSICRKAMARRPKDRFDSMRELADTLDRFLKASPGQTPLDINVDPPGPIGRPRVGAALDRTKPSGTEVSHRAPSPIGRKLKANAFWAVPVSAVMIALGGYEISNRTPEPTASPAKAKREETRPAKSFISPLTGMTFIRIEPGQFVMGTSVQQRDKLYEQIPYAKDRWFLDEWPQHTVSMTRPFYLAKHEVTVGQFDEFVKATGYLTNAKKDSAKQQWRWPGYVQGNDYPVTCVSYEDAQAFVNWMNKQEGTAKRRYRLPTEAEWEYACRAGTSQLYGDSDDPESLLKVANVSDATHKKTDPRTPVSIAGNDGYAHAAPVGSFAPNAWGLHDMIGNVREWCDDWYDVEFYHWSPKSDPQNQRVSGYKVFRGGGWYGSEGHHRPAFRSSAYPAYHDNYLGFRVAASLE